MSEWEARETKVAELRNQVQNIVAYLEERRDSETLEEISSIVSNAIVSVGIQKAGEKPDFNVTR